MRLNQVFKFYESKDDEFVTVYFEGKELRVPSGISVAAALLANGIYFFRASSVNGSKRSPYCMMGVCFECLLEIGGVPALQGCMIGVRNGMIIKRQIGNMNVKKLDIETY